VLEPIIISGMITGLIYALIALGFTLVYGISGIVNLTHGAFFVVGPYLYGILLNYIPKLIPPDLSYLTPTFAIIFSILLTGIIGSVFYRITLHQLLGEEVSILIASICACIAFQQVIFITMGSFYAFSFTIPSLVEGMIRIINTDVLTGRALAALISLASFIILGLYISKTKTGRAMKALSQDLEAAMLMGVSTEKLFMFTAALSAGIGGLGGILHASTVAYGTASHMWMLGLALAFTVVVLGGLGSIKGSFFGGLILGFTQEAVMRIFPGSGVLQDSIPFIVVILALLIRPKGLFGKRIEME